MSCCHHSAFLRACECPKSAVCGSSPEGGMKLVLACPGWRYRAGQWPRGKRHPAAWSHSQRGCPGLPAPALRHHPRGADPPWPALHRLCGCLRPASLRLHHQHPRQLTLRHGRQSTIRTGGTACILAKGMVKYDRPLSPAHPPRLPSDLMHTDRSQW